MLFKITDHKGRERYINPIYVKSLLAKGPSETEVEVSGWAAKMRVRLSADEVALMVNAAMPDAAEYIASEESERQARDAAKQASAAMMG